MRVVLGMVLSIFSLPVLLRLVSGGILLLWLRLGLVYLCLSIWLALFSILKAAILDAWRSKVSADLYDREGFRCGPLLDVHGSLQLIVLLMLEREIRLCFVASWLEWFSPGQG